MIKKFAMRVLSLFIVFFAMNCYASGMNEVEKNMNRKYISNRA